MCMNVFESECRSVYVCQCVSLLQCVNHNTLDVVVMLDEVATVTRNNRRWMFASRMTETLTIIVMG